MNISQANHSFQQNPNSEGSQVTSEITDSEAFFNELSLAQDGPEWFTESTDTKARTEKERVNEEQQAKRRETEDFQDELAVGLASQGYVNQLKQSDASENARILSESENQDRLMQHVEKKHLHTPTVVEDADANRAENNFTKAMKGELDGNKNSILKDVASIANNADGDEIGKSTRLAHVKPSDPLASEALHRFDVGMLRGVKPPPAGKPVVQNSEKGLSELSKLSATEAASGKSTAKNASAKVMSLSGMAETSAEGRRADSGQKTQAGSPRQPTTVNIKDVAGNVKIMISSKTNEMVMKLAPEHLGKLEIRLKKDGEKMIGRFKVENTLAKDAIELQLPQLKESLAEQGIHIEEFSVFVDGDDASNQSFAFQEGLNGEAGQEEQSGRSESDTASSLSVKESSDAASRSGASGLNIYA